MFDVSSQFELLVLPNGRSAADEYYHQGAMWIEGRESSKYTLKFTNRSSSRVNVIFSVDGLDTIKGQPAGPNSDGYVINANDSLEIPGWTLDDKTAAEFYFSKAGRSYVAASGNNTSNTGVIGAMVFKENAPYFTCAQPYPYFNTTIPFTGMAQVGANINQMNIVSDLGGGAPKAGSNMTYGAASSSVRSMSVTEQEVGTGFGDATTFNTYKTSFDRISNIPDAVLAIYYNSAKNLQKMGINVKTLRSQYDNSSAQPFPAYTPGCIPPAGWKP